MISLVVPLFRSPAELPALLERTQAALAATGEAWELILVDDACPMETGAGACGLPIHGSVHLLRLGRNVGQHAALQRGLRETRGTHIAFLDGDLQDRPEDLARLLAALGPADVVCAGRRGHYTRPGREWTGQLFRATRYLVSRGRIPADAGLFLCATRAATERLLTLDDPGVNLVSAFSRSGARIVSVPIERALRETGSGAYTNLRRLRAATSALADATPLHPWMRRLRARRYCEPEVVRRKLLVSTDSNPS